MYTTFNTLRFPHKRFQCTLLTKLWIFIIFHTVSYLSYPWTICISYFALDFISYSPFVMFFGMLRYERLVAFAALQVRRQRHPSRTATSISWPCHYAALPAWTRRTIFSLPSYILACFNCSCASYPQSVHKNILASDFCTTQNIFIEVTRISSCNLKIAH